MSKSILHCFLYIFLASVMLKLKNSLVQLNQYEKAPYFLQLSQNLRWNCLLISAFLPVFAWCDHKIVFDWSAEQFYDHIMQKLVRTGKNTEINKQSHVKFWLNWRKYETVSYLFSCIYSDDVQNYSFIRFLRKCLYPNSRLQAYLLCAR